MKLGSTRWVGLALITFSIVLSAAGQLCMKVGMQELGGAGPTASVPTALILTPAVAWTAAGLLSYGLSMLAWLGVLVRFPLSFAYPLLGVSYVLVYAGATQWPRLIEDATPLRTAGTLLIAAGVALVSSTGGQATTVERRR